MRRTFGFLALVALAACQPKPVTMTDAQKAAIADSVRTMMTGMIDKMNQGDMTSGWAMYSADADTRYTENGMTYPNLDAMKKMSQDMSGAMEAMTIKPDAVDVMVVGPDAAVVTSPFHMTVKVKGKPAYDGVGVWTGVLERRGGKWMIVSTHESVQHADQMMVALTPPPAKPAK
ncbi:MAG: nuclear transport factor 2 family protein [Gemmatimonadetes bacterium]|nr:nuclear transport factor 2 family protein [Gemmatimonadota bacterium]